MSVWQEIQTPEQRVSIIPLRPPAGDPKYTAEMLSAERFPTQIGSLTTAAAYQRNALPKNNIPSRSSVSD